MSLPVNLVNKILNEYQTKYQDNPNTIIKLDKEGLSLDEKGIGAFFRSLFSKVSFSAEEISSTFQETFKSAKYEDFSKGQLESTIKALQAFQSRVSKAEKHAKAVADLSTTIEKLKKLKPKETKPKGKPTDTDPKATSPSRISTGHNPNMKDTVVSTASPQSQPEVSQPAKSKKKNEKPKEPVLPKTPSELLEASTVPSSQALPKNSSAPLQPQTPEKTKKENFIRSLEDTLKNRHTPHLTKKRKIEGPIDTTYIDKLGEASADQLNSIPSATFFKALNATYGQDKVAAAVAWLQTPHKGQDNKDAQAFRKALGEFQKGKGVISPEYQLYIAKYVKMHATGNFLGN